MQAFVATLQVDFWDELRRDSSVELELCVAILHRSENSILFRFFGIGILELSLGDAVVLQRIGPVLYVEFPSRQITCLIIYCLNYIRRDGNSTYKKA